jgi:hypothetical protein
MPAPMTATPMGELVMMCLSEHQTVVWGALLKRFKIVCRPPFNPVKGLF